MKSVLPSVFVFFLIFQVAKVLSFLGREEDAEEVLMIVKIIHGGGGEDNYDHNGGNGWWYFAGAFCIQAAIPE